MSFPGMRRALRAEPRWMIALLLAFAIETLPTATLFMQHRHAGGDLAHAHAGLSAHVRAVDGTARHSGEGLTRAPARDLHVHAVSPVVVVDAAAVAAPAPTLVARTLSQPSVPDAPTAVLSPGQARAPPSSLEA